LRARRKNRRSEWHCSRILRDRERDQLRRGDPWSSARTGPDRQEIVHQHIKCGEKVVEVGEHETTSVVDVATATPTFDGLPIPPGPALTSRLVPCHILATWLVM
jgi:hypothetical protein